MADINDVCVVITACNGKAPSHRYGGMETMTGEDTQSYTEGSTWLKHG